MVTDRRTVASAPLGAETEIGRVAAEAADDKAGRGPLRAGTRILSRW